MFNVEGIIMLMGLLIISSLGGLLCKHKTDAEIIKMTNEIIYSVDTIAIK